MSESYSDVIAQLRQRTRWEGALSMASFTLAGVQDFVSAARTTRDVWSGSFLISLLSRESAAGMLTYCESTLAGRKSTPPDAADRWLLLPSALAFTAAASGDVASFPNSVLVVVPGTPGQAKGAIDAAAAALDRTWNGIVGSVFKEFGPLLDRAAVDQWNRQTRLDRTIEHYGTVVPIPTDEAAFDALRSQWLLDAAAPPAATLLALAGRTLGARKMLRDFQQVGEEGTRCGLCGARAALADYETLPARSHAIRVDRTGKPVRDRILQHSHATMSKFWSGPVRQKFDRHEFRTTERLCAVCVVRRLAPKLYLKPKGLNENFPSMSSIAAAPALGKLFVEALSNPMVKDAAGRLSGAIGKISEKVNAKPGRTVPLLEKAALTDQVLKDLARTDGDWFYTGRYDAADLGREFGADINELTATIGDVGNPIVNFRKELADAKAGPVPFPPDTYVAVIAADGDKMGEWIDGSHPGWKTEFTLLRQQALSECLHSFAKKAEALFATEIPGRLVYAGGDDVLVFVPAECALWAMRALNDTFEASVRQPMALSITLSFGCSLVKRSDPLTGAIDTANRLLKDVAKEEYGRDAFAIRRSTDGREAGGRNSLLPHLESLQKLMSPGTTETVGGGLSPALIQAIARDRFAFEDDWVNPSGPSHAPAAMRALVRRAVRRAWHSTDMDNGAREAGRRSVQQQVVALLDELPGSPSSTPCDSTLSLLVDLLSHCRFLSRAS